MKRSRVAVALTILSFFALLAVAVAVRSPSKSIRPPTPVQTGPQSSSSAVEAPAPETVAYNCEAGNTVLELLRKKVSDNLEVKTYSIGTMVESINGVKGGTGNKYWLYFIDGKSATVSADTYRCREGESIEWKFTADSGM